MESNASNASSTKSKPRDNSIDNDATYVWQQDWDTNAEEQQISQDVPPVKDEERDNILGGYLQDPLHKDHLKELAKTKSVTSLYDIEEKIIQYQRERMEDQRETKRAITSLSHQMDELTKLCSYNCTEIGGIKKDKARLKEFTRIDAKFGKCFELKGPTTFSPVPTLKDPFQARQHYKIFPFINSTRKYDPKEKQSMPIRSFLTSINRAQERLNLSEEEFKQELLEATQGEIREHLDVWIESNDSIDDLYFKLVSIYDKRITHEKAQKMLDDFKITKDMSLMDITSEIAKLACYANSHYPTSDVRTFRINETSINALYRVLPRQSKFLAKSKHMELTQLKDGKAVSFSELVTRLRMSQEQIEDDIRHSVAEEQTSTENKTTPFRRNGYMSYKYRPKVNSINSHGVYDSPISGSNEKNIVSDHPLVNPPENKSHRNQRNWAPSNNNYNNVNNYNNNRFQNRRDNYRGNSNGSQNFNGYKRGQNYERNKLPLKLYCSLCGFTDHTPVSGCRFMVTDQGGRITVCPTSEPCTKCPANVKPLRHPEANCPYRRGGPLAHKESVHVPNKSDN